MKDKLLIIILLVIITIILIYIIICKKTTNNIENKNYNLLKNKEKFEETQGIEPNILALTELNIKFKLKNFILNGNNDINLNKINNNNFKIKDSKIRYISLNDLKLDKNYKIEKDEINNYLDIINNNNNNNKFDNKLKDMIKEYEVDPNVSHIKGSPRRPIRINAYTQGHSPNKPEPLTYLVNNLESVNDYLKNDIDYQITKDEKFKKHDYFIAKRTGEKISEYRPFTCFYDYKDKFKGKKNYLKASTYKDNCNALKFEDYVSPIQSDIEGTKNYFKDQELYFKIDKIPNRIGYQMKLVQNNDNIFEAYFYNLKEKDTLVKIINDMLFITTLNNPDYLLKRVNIPINKQLVLVTENGSEIKINKSTNHLDRSNADLISSGHPNICEISMDDINTSLRNGFFDKNKPSNKKKTGRIVGAIGSAALGFALTGKQSKKLKDEADTYDEKLRKWKKGSQKLGLDAKLGICKKEYKIKEAKLIERDVYINTNNKDLSYSELPEDFQLEIVNFKLYNDTDNNDNKFLIYSNDRKKIIYNKDNLLHINDTSNKDVKSNIDNFNFKFNDDIWKEKQSTNPSYYNLFNDNKKYIIYNTTSTPTPTSTPTSTSRTLNEFFILYEDTEDNFNYKFLNSNTEQFELYNPDNKEYYKLKIYLNNNIDNSSITTSDSNIDANFKEYQNQIYTEDFFIKLDDNKRIINDKKQILYYNIETNNYLFDSEFKYDEAFRTIYNINNDYKCYLHTNYSNTNMIKLTSTPIDNLYKYINLPYLPDLPHLYNHLIETNNYSKYMIMKKNTSNQVYHFFYDGTKYDIKLLNPNEIKYYALYKNNLLIEAYSPYFYIDKDDDKFKFKIPNTNNLDDDNKLNNDNQELNKYLDLNNKINCLNGDPKPPNDCENEYEINDYNPTIYKDYKFKSLINNDIISIENVNANLEFTKIKLINNDNKFVYNIDGKFVYNIDGKNSENSEISDLIKDDVYFEYRTKPYTNQFQPEHTKTIIKDIDFLINKNKIYNNYYLDELQKINTSLDTNISNLNIIKQKKLNTIKQHKLKIQKENNTFVKRIETSFIPLYIIILKKIWKLTEINKNISYISLQLQNKVKFAVFTDKQVNYIASLDEKITDLTNIQKMLKNKVDSLNNKNYDELIKTQIHIESANLLIKEINRINSLTKETFEDSKNSHLQLKYTEYNNKQNQFYKDNIYNLQINLQIKNNEQQKLNDENELLQKLIDEHYNPITLMLSSSTPEKSYHYYFKNLQDKFNKMKKYLETEISDRELKFKQYNKDFKKSKMVRIHIKKNKLDVFNKELEIEQLQNTNNELNDKINEYNKLKPFNLQSKLKKLQDLKYTLNHNLNKYNVFESFVTASSQYNNNQLAMDSINENNKQYKILMNGKCLSSYKSNDYKLNNCAINSRSQYFTPRLIQNELQAKNINKDYVIPSDRIKYPYYQIRSTLSNDCIVSSKDGIKVTPCSSNNIKQQWKLSKNDNICINN